MTGTVLILGASGKIGQHAAQAFSAAGWTVRRHMRGGDLTRDAMGADVIVNGLNPPGYRDWAQAIPAITAQVIAAARASGATVIVPGNVYVFGPRGGVWSESTPHDATTRKGRIRAAMEAAYRAAGVRTIILRAGNLIDPDHGGDVMDLVVMRDIRRGRLTAPGDPAALQAYAYVPDWAHAAVALAEGRADLPVFADIPFPGHAFTLHDLAAETARALGRPVRIVPFPWWAMRLAAPVWTLARELLEMRYLWSLPHRLDGAALKHLLPSFAPTPLEVVMRAGLPDDIHPDQAMGTGGKPVLAQ